MVPKGLRIHVRRFILFNVVALLALFSAGGKAAWAGPAYGAEVEPNGTSATATPIAGTSAVIKANVFPNGDQDFYSFNAAAGDRVYAALQTAWSASASTDSILELFGPDGTTLIEGDEDDGSFGTLSSTIANVPIPAAGTYFLRVRHNSATGQLRPYFLYFQLRTGTPTPETEPNDTFPGQALPAGGWVSGATSAAADLDFFSVNLNAGDTVYLSLDLDPERNGDWNGQLGMGAFDTLVLLVNDSGAGFAPFTAPDSEAYFMTVKDAGTYGIFVGVPAGATPGTYTLNATVFPNVDEGVNCTTYTSTNVPTALPDLALATSTLTVPGNPRIADLNLSIQGTHTFMADLDFHLISPAGNDNGFATDVFNGTVGGRTALDVIFDDEAAIPPAFQVSAGMIHQPELAYRLSWYDGENAGGTWTLAIRDDASGDVGTITGWSLRICEPPPPPACAAGFTPTTVFSTDFESGAAGFTHSGTQDEWELGLPATAATTTANPVAAFNTCNSGTSCWKTDLDNTYNTSSNQDLLSPAINLAGLSAPVVVSWAHRYQMDTATNDHYNVSIRQVGAPATAVNLFEFLDAVMTDAVGNPAVNIGESAGWGVMERRADTFAGQNVELLFHLDSGTGVTNFGGAAIDDVTVTACRALVSDLSITKTDGVTTAVPGGSVTYTITASNAGTDPVTGATVADTFPAILTCTWTCVGAGGGTCTAAGSGNISDTVNLPVGGSVTYTATCTIDPSATGTLSNTATVTAAGDPNPADNSATDTDTLTPQADLAITKTDGVTSVTPGGSTTYTITASNAGPSNAPGATVADTFPASLTCTWTCVGAGGGTCTAAGSGNVSDTVNLPAGGSVTYTASCTVSGAASGSITNTATVAAPAGVTDPNPANNSATDVDTVATLQADLSITKTDGVASVTPGGSLTYTITASNAGPGAATGATVTDTFPASLTCTWTCVGAGGGTCTAAGSGNISDTVNLPAGGSVTYTASCTVSGSASGSITNTATVTSPAGVGDPDPANNSATDTDTVAGGGAGANVSGTKTVTTAGPYEVGDAITYSVVLTNNGAGAQADNPGNEFTDVLPAQLGLVSATATSGTAVATVGTNTVTWNGAIPAGGSVTITINATILPAAAGTTVANQGTISFDSDGNGTNDGTAQTDDPAVAGPTNPTTITVVGGGVDPTEIPTLSSLGLLFLALALAGLALGLMRRRQRA